MFFSKLFRKDAASCLEKGEKLLAMMLEKNLDYIARLRGGRFTDPIR